MHILFYSWNSANELITLKHLRALGHEVSVVKTKIRNYTEDTEFVENVVPVIINYEIEAMFSLNYFPVISVICDIMHIPYYSWVYDSPCLTLYTDHAKLGCNKIGVFDLDEVSKLHALGVTSVFHLPLAVDSNHFIAGEKTASNRPDLVNDISFVGSLYNGPENYFNALPADDTTREESLNILKDHLFMQNALPTALREHNAYNHLIDSWYDALKSRSMLLGDSYFYSKESLVTSQIFERKLTELERTTLLGSIAEHFPGQFSLFTASNVSSVDSLNSCAKGIVNYDSEMPIVFKHSKININVTLRSIHSGIPLRALDIIACEGFLLTNPQPELYAYLHEGKDYVAFYDIEDCINKIDYYLAHDNERREIAANGYKKIQEHFSYPCLLKKLLS